MCVDSWLTKHAEENAILQTERHLLDGATLYCTHEPCEKCAKSIAQAGIKRIVFRHAYPNKYNHFFLKGIKVVYLPKKPIIFLDIDDVGNDLCEFLFDTHNRENNESFDWRKSKTFMLAENEGIKVGDEYFKEVLHREGTFLNLKPKKGYVEVIRKLIDEGFDVRLLTHPQWTSPYCLKEKMQWVQKHLPFFHLDDHLIMTRIKHEVAGEGKILLDDNPEHLRKWEEKGGIGIAFAEIEYSKAWDGKKVENFDQFYELVHKLAR